MMAVKLFVDDLKKSNTFLNALYDDVTSAIFLADRDARIYNFNNAFRTLFYKPEDQLLKQLCGNAMSCIFRIQEEKDCGQTSQCHDCVLRQNIIRTMVKKVPIYKERLRREFLIKGVVIEKIFSFTTKYIHYNTQELILVIVDDITDLEQQRRVIEDQRNRLAHLNRVLQAKNQSLEEMLIGQTMELGSLKKQLSTSLADKESLLKEIQHRVGNNLAIIAALIQLQQEQLNPENCLERMEETENRILIIKKLHDMLFSFDYMAAVPAPAYMESLLQGLCDFYKLERSCLPAGQAIAAVMLSVRKALSLGLIFNEFFLIFLKELKIPGHNLQFSLRQGEAPDLFQLDFKLNVPLSDPQTRVGELQFLNLFIHPAEGSVTFSLAEDFSCIVCF